MHRMQNESAGASLYVLNNLLLHGYICGADIIYLEPYCETPEEVYNVCYETNGKKEVSIGLPLYVTEQVILRLKNMANMKASDTEGFVEVRMKDKRHSLHFYCDLHIRIVPLARGQQIAIYIQYIDYLPKPVLILE